MEKFASIGVDQIGAVLRWNEFDSHLVGTNIPGLVFANYASTRSHSCFLYWASIVVFHGRHIAKTNLRDTKDNRRSQWKEAHEWTRTEIHAQCVTIFTTVYIFYSGAHTWDKLRQLYLNSNLWRAFSQTATNSIFVRMQIQETTKT